MEQHCKWIVHGTVGLRGKGCTRMRPKLHLPVLGRALRATGDMACSSFGRLRCDTSIYSRGTSVGATHQTVLERGTAEHSDRPHRGQASAAKSKPPELGPSGPRWTRCDNRRNFLYNRSNCLTINPYAGIRETTHFSNRSG